MKGNNEIILYSINLQQDLKTLNDNFDKRAQIDDKYTFFKEN